MQRLKLCFVRTPARQRWAHGTLKESTIFPTDPKQNKSSFKQVLLTVLSFKQMVGVIIEIRDGVIIKSVNGIIYHKQV